MLLADTSFLDVLWWMLVFFFWVMYFWIFISIVGDLFRRDDIGGWLKALWIVVVILAPFLGTLIYLLFRPAGGTREERVAIDAANRDFVQKYSPDSRAEQLRVLSDLHDRGKLSDSEFAAEKNRLLGATTN